MEMTEDETFESFTGSLVKVVYRDGERIETKHGDLTEAFAEFIELRTKKNIYLLNRNDIIKIQRKLEGEE